MRVDSEGREEAAVDEVEIGHADSWRAEDEFGGAAGDLNDAVTDFDLSFFGGFLFEDVALADLVGGVAIERLEDGGVRKALEKPLAEILLSRDLGVFSELQGEARVEAWRNKNHFAAIQLRLGLPARGGNEAEFVGSDDAEVTRDFTALSNLHARGEHFRSVRRGEGACEAAEGAAGEQFREANHSLEFGLMSVQSLRKTVRALGMHGGVVARSASFAS